MATVNEKMTQLANAIRSKSGASGKLTLDGMITAVNGITTGGGTSYQLWGSHSVKPDGIEAQRFAGTYTLPVESMFTWFHNYDDYGWSYEDVREIKVFSNGNIEVYSARGLWKYYDYDEGLWYDEEDNHENDAHLKIFHINNPITVSQNLYNLFVEIADNATWDMDVYMLGYDIGFIEGLPALGTLCDWTAMVDSFSSLVMTFVNYHPFCTMECDIYFDGDYDTIIVPPNDSASYNWMEDMGSVNFGRSDMSFGVENVRWVSNE